MSRQNGSSRVAAFASATAILALMAGCSQPASYATVDLGGSYGNGAQQAYSAASGLPVYQATQVYTTPYDAGPPQSRSQLVYLDAPANQVASLSPSYGQQSYPSFGAEQSGPFLTDETVLRSDGYIDTGVYGGVQTAALAPGAGSIGFDQMPVMSDVPQYLPAPQPFAQQSFSQSTPLPYSEPVMLETVPLPAPAPVQEYAYENYEQVAPVQTYAEAAPAYAPLATPIETTPLDMMQVAPQVFAELPPQQYVEQSMSVPQRMPQTIEEVGDYYNLRTEQQAPELRQEARFPAAIPAPAPAPAPVRAFSAPNGGGITLPSASQEYPRPYEALPPGFFPTYDFPSGNDLISQAPVAEAPLQQFASLAPMAPVDDIFTSGRIDAAPVLPPIQQATFGTVAGSSYTIQPGDTLYAIARMHGVAPMDIAKANDLPLAGTIYPGNTLTIPSQQMAGGPQSLGDAPIVVLQSPQSASISTYSTDLSDQSVEMIDIAELARMFRDRESGQPGAGIPVISASAADALRGRVDMTPTERLAEPIAPVMGTTIIPNSELAMPMQAAPMRAAPMQAAMAPGSYSWPVHGDVFRLEQGGIEIAAPAGRTVSAAAAGRVVHVESGPRGYLVVIEHDDGWRSLTLGLEGATVQPGERVFSGGTLGYTGSQRVTFELRDGASNVAETLGMLRS